MATIKKTHSRRYLRKYGTSISSPTFVGLLVFSFSLIGIGDLDLGCCYEIRHGYGPSVACTLKRIASVGGAACFYNPHTLNRLVGFEECSRLAGRICPSFSCVGVAWSCSPSWRLRFFRSKEHGQPPDDFAKQMLTLVGTLMTAVISFYFGSSIPNEVRADHVVSNRFGDCLAPGTGAWSTGGARQVRERHSCGRA